MKLLYDATTLRRLKTDAIVLFVSEQKKGFPEALASHRKVFGKRLERAIELADFKGKEGEVIEFPTEGKHSSPRLLIIGLGDASKLSLERFRRAAATAARCAPISFLLPP